MIASWTIFSTSFLLTENHSHRSLTIFDSYGLKKCVFAFSADRWIDDLLHLKVWQFDMLPVWILFHIYREYADQFCKLARKLCVFCNFF